MKSPCAPIAVPPAPTGGARGLTRADALRVQPLASGRHALFSSAGDHVFIDEAELSALRSGHLHSLAPATVANLFAKHVIGDASQVGMSRLLTARRSARRETVESGVSLHIIVPTLQCAHSCKYCQVSRTLDSTSHALSPQLVDAACDTCFESPSKTLTVEFQGGDPLVRFDLVRRAIERLARRNLAEHRQLRYVVASTLHQLDDDMCSFMREHDVHLSTSIDGPASLHNANRPLPGRDAYERTVAGIELARARIGRHSVAALMTTTRASLAMPEAIVDEYVRLGFSEIVLRPLARYGFAKRNAARLAYTTAEFAAFYERGLERVLYWNRNGFALREGTAAVVLNKLLSPFDAGYVDQQSPTGAGSAVVVYNYDGYVYPSDEARMLAETGDTGLRLGRIGVPLNDLLKSAIVQSLRVESDGEAQAACGGCPFNTFCGPDPIAARAELPELSVYDTEHCKRSKWIFGQMLDRIDRAQTECDELFLDLAYAWARGISSISSSSVA